MDILALPDVFHQMLMRKMKISDRLTMRLTCRAFAKLVAESHAGYFQDGFISKKYPDDPQDSTLRLVIGDETFHDSSEAGLEKFLQLRHRLFNGITFGRWEFRLSDTPLTSEFLNAFTENFKATDKFMFQVDTKEHFDFALEFMAKFPTTDVFLDVGFLPSLEQLRSLPPIEELMITAPLINRNRIGFGDSYDQVSQISGDLFFELLATHKNLYLDNVLLTSGEWERALQTISEDPNARLVQIGTTRTTMAKWMKDYSITKNMEAGDTSGEFEVLNELKSRQMVELRYRNCTLWIERFDWTSGDQPVHLELQNVADPWAFPIQFAKENPEQMMIHYS